MVELIEHIFKRAIKITFMTGQKIHSTNDGVGFLPVDERRYVAVDERCYVTVHEQQKKV